MIYPFENCQLLRILPAVTRARDFHLYLENGKRLTDLWLFGGRAVLGHKPPHLLVELKNAAERALFSPLPHPAERRFLKALEALFPGRAFRLYGSPASLRRAVDKALEKAALPQDAVSVWRPFLKAYNGTPVIIPVLPWPPGPEVLVLEKSLEESFPPGELLPPVLLAPAARAVYSLIKAMNGQSRQKYPRIEKALKRNRSGRQANWRLDGIYLTLEGGAGQVTLEQSIDPGKYEALFRRFLEGGFLIPPSPLEPVILPALMSKGEESKLASLLEED